MFVANSVFVDRESTSASVFIITVIIIIAF